MNTITPTITGYNPSDTILTTESTKAKQATGNTEYDGSKIDNLSLQSGKLVSFTNQDGNNVKVYIDNSILDKLSSKFGNDSFTSTDSNTLNASGKAQEYLAGFWKVAQTNILSADKDGNGIIEGSEVLDVKTNVGEDGSINTATNTMNVSISGLRSINEDGGLSQQAKNSIAGQIGPMSIDTIFNQLLNYDKNSDGKLNTGELISQDKLNSIYNKFANSNDGLALEAEVKIGDRTVTYEEYMPSAKQVQESEKNKRTKQTQETLTDDDKQKIEEKKTEEVKKSQEVQAKQQTDNIDNSNTDKTTVSADSQQQGIV